MENNTSAPVSPKLVNVVSPVQEAVFLGKSLGTCSSIAVFELPDNQPGVVMGFRQLTPNATGRKFLDLKLSEGAETPTFDLLINLSTSICYGTTAEKQALAFSCDYSIFVWQSFETKLEKIQAPDYEGDPEILTEIIRCATAETLHNMQFHGYKLLSASPLN